MDNPTKKLTLDEIIKAITDYLGIAPHYKKIEWVSETDWVARKYNPNGRAFYDLNTQFLRVREGCETSVIHELIHSALNRESVEYSWLDIVEGIVEASTQEIAKILGVSKPLTYIGHVLFIDSVLLPALQETLPQFAQGYRAAPDKGRYLKDSIVRGFQAAGGSSLPPEVEATWYLAFNKLSEELGQIETKQNTLQASKAMLSAALKYDKPSPYISQEPQLTRPNYRMANPNSRDRCATCINYSGGGFTLINGQACVLCRESNPSFEIRGTYVQPNYICDRYEFTMLGSRLDVDYSSDIDIDNTNFATIAEWEKFIERRKTKYGSGNAYLSSPEWGMLYYKYFDIYVKEQEQNEIKYAQEILRAFAELGLQYGDKVRYMPIQSEFQMMMQMTGQGAVFTGTLIKKNGLPHVQLDVPYKNKKVVPWHLGFKKVQ
jgi:hypothetical protein